MRLNSFLKAVFSQPPRITLQKVSRLIHSQWQSRVVRKRDFFYSTYSRNFTPTAVALESYLKKIPEELLLNHKEQIISLTNLYLNHTFDLLGSGWLEIRHGMDCPGLEGHRYNMGTALQIDPQGNWLNRRINASNKAYSKKVWRMVARDYVPIDWQLDFKSGYQWQEKRPASKCAPAPLPGVDIKVPWELSRMQHLPQLALAYSLSCEGVKESYPRETYSNEFRNMILDFIATNPPRFGVNWHCPMDVGIRVSNWLIAYDLLKTQGVNFDSEFEQVFQNSIYDHGLHIIQNLEWNPTLRSNHYLADITGLLFVSAYLPRTPVTDTWLAFSVQELIQAAKEQFHPDGSNFEGSTCYHRLSAEMLVYATALILGLSENKREALLQYQTITPCPGLQLQKAPLPFFTVPGLEQTSPLPQSHFEQLERIDHFTRAVIKPNGQAIQIGDNDSGRFLKLLPKFHEVDSNKLPALYQNLKNYKKPDTVNKYWMEEQLNFTHLVQAVNALLQKQEDSSKPSSVDAQVIRSLARGKTISSFNTQPLRFHPTFHTDSFWQEARHNLDKLTPEQIYTYDIFGQEHNLKSGLEYLSFPDFGLYLMISTKMFLSIRCGSVGQNGNGGHAHNDALSIELQIDGVDQITDPGSYLYTPLPEARNTYRSAKAHFAPYVHSQEPNPIGSGLFQLEDRAQAQCLYFGEKGFIGMHRGYGSPLYRLIQVEDEKLIIKDGIDGPEKLVPLDPLNPNHGLPFSSGYGIRYY